MSDIAIRVENLSKRYRIGAQQEPYKALRDMLTNAIRAPFRRFGSTKHSSDNSTIWALKDICFEVRQGEVVGIIGRNGAGKSSLLKILSRVTIPTEGYAELHGRIGSLLEVGTGFHPELTGRENIYVNGAILGMKKIEIDRKFDEIVAFAEIEKFLDTPVKRYSSGMYVRLAFAVAAHLEPEILLVDEVLAVGDASFQKKCLGKMNDVAREGRTVLFVSHNMNAINLFCPRAILLVQGHAVRDGISSSVVTEYLMGSHESHGERVWSDPHTAPGNDRVRLHAVRIISDGQVTGDVEIQKEVFVEVEFWNFKPGALLSPSIHLLDKTGNPVLCSVNYPAAGLPQDEWFDRPYPAGLFRTRCILPGNFLNEGRYGISAFIRTNVSNQEAMVLEAVWFTVHDTSATHREAGSWGGVVRPPLAWQTQFRGSLSQ